MALDYTKKTSRRGIPFIDIYHVIMSVAVVVLFIITIVDFDRNRRLLPYVMGLIALVDIGETIYKIQHLPHGKKNLGGVFLSAGLAILFLLIAAFMWLTFNW